MVRHLHGPGEAAYSLLASADARLIEDAAACEGRYGRHRDEEGGGRMKKEMEAMSS